MLGYYRNNGVLMHKSVEKVMPKTDDYVTKHRIVVPTKYRPALLLRIMTVELPHSTLFSGVQTG